VGELDDVLASRSPTAYARVQERLVEIDLSVAIDLDLTARRAPVRRAMSG